MIGFNEYQIKAHRTAEYPKELGLVYPVTGLVGEAGEIAEKMKKALRNGDLYIMPNGEMSALRPDLQAGFVKELGDELWYMAEIATVLGVELLDVAMENNRKLADRSFRGVIIGEGDDR